VGLAASGDRSDTGQSSVLVLLIQSGQARVGLRVDAIEHEHEVVLKSFGAILQRARNYVGATIVAGGEVVPVLNARALLTAALQGGPTVATYATRPVRESRHRTILVAEDSITSRSLLKNILQTAGYEVRTAVDGADALATLKFEAVDLVISDVQMPQVDGFELTSKIRADSALSTLPVILVTSLANREDRTRGMEAGANAYIIKGSFDQSDLLAAVRRLLP
jgi:two-component system, chemotaxis family, sensor kinase CheA